MKTKIEFDDIEVVRDDCSIWIEGVAFVPTGADPNGDKVFARFDDDEDGDIEVRIAAAQVVDSAGDHMATADELAEHDDAIREAVKGWIDEHAD
jgi:hypothetical protein